MSKIKEKRITGASSTTSRYRTIVEDILESCDIRIDGARPWDLTVHDERFFKRVVTDGALGLGESYMDGWWNTDELDSFIFRIMRNYPEGYRVPWHQKITLLKDRVINRQNHKRAFTVGEKHYDLGNDLFKIMLDRRMIYTCGYWKHASTLDEAQEHKLDLVCRKIGLKPGQKVLDIGCGWGGFMKYAAEKYGASAVGVTVSKEQAELGRELCKGLPVEFRLQDYREVTGRFDHVVSLGMFEHVGPKNYRTYFKKAAECLKDDGFLLLHTIGNIISDRATNPFNEKYIFPNGVIPSIRQIGEATENLFVMEDWHNFGQDYDPTLLAWNKNFEKGWKKLRPVYGDSFYRMWRFFLLSSAGSFRSRNIQLWQIVFTKKGVVGGYKPIR